MNLRFAALAFAVLCAALPARAEGLYSYDASVPMAPVLGAARTLERGVVAQDVRVTSPTGHTVTGEIVRGTRKGKHPGVLFVHWLGEPRTTNHTEFEPDAIALARRGAVSLLIDAMWSAPNWFDTVGADAAKDGPLVEAQVIDLRRALDLLLAQDGVDAGHVAFVAHDFGAMFGALMANVEMRPSSWVLMAGVPTLAEWYRFGKAKQAMPDYAGYAAAMARYDIAGGLAKLSGKAVLFQFAAKDYFIAEAEALAFIGAVPGAKTAIFYDTDHALAVPAAAADRDGWLAKALF
ncbi:MAG TPA: hypothetical protein VII56_01495 [Rhizomicrobium sp.]